MDISRELAIKILRYLDERKDFYFPFLIMNKEYTEEDDDFVEIEPDEWKMIADDETYQTFQLWENVQNLFADTVELMAEGFIEKITDESELSANFKVDRDEVEKIAGRKLTDKQLIEIFTAIENDQVLWSEIERSIIAAVNFYQ